MPQTCIYFQHLLDRYIFSVFENTFEFQNLFETTIRKFSIKHEMQYFYTEIHFFGLRSKLFIQCRSFEKYRILHILHSGLFFKDFISFLRTELMFLNFVEI